MYTQSMIQGQHNSINAPMPAAAAAALHDPTPPMASYSPTSNNQEYEFGDAMKNAGYGTPSSPLLDSFYAHGGSDTNYGGSGGGLFGGGLFGSLGGAVIMNEFLF